MFRFGLYYMDRYNGDYYDYIEVALFSVMVFLAVKYEKNTIFNNKIIYFWVNIVVHYMLYIHVYCRYHITYGRAHGKYNILCG